MQPILSITAPVAGMVCVNGRFAGEASAQEPLLLPVSAWGALYIEFQPLEEGWQGFARRLTISDGRIVAQGLARDVYVVEWPGAVSEVELAPPRAQMAERRQLCLEQGIAYALLEGAQTQLELGALRVPLPDGAGLPKLRVRDEQLLFLGETADGGEYLAAVSADGKRVGGVLSAAHIELEEAVVHAVFRQEDLVGHARLEVWRLEESLALESVEPAWADGAPHWPESAENTVLAALQAAFLGLDGEAEGYLAPKFAGSGLIRARMRGFNGCTALKYALPDARNAVGLLRAEAPNFARVTPLYYRASPMGGPQGAWRIESLEF